MAGIYELAREAVRVKVKKCEGNLPPEWRKFSVDPQITTLEVLYSILAKAFDLKSDFSISYKAIDPNGQEVYLAVLSDWDLDAAFLRAHNHSISNGTDPCLSLVVEIKPFSEAADWDAANATAAASTSDTTLSSTTTGKEVTPLQQSLEVGQKYVQNMQTRLPGFFMNHMGKTFSMVTRALNFVEDQTNLQPIRPPVSDVEFLSYCDSVGQIVQAKNLRKAIYNGGIEPGLRRVVWKDILNVYPEGMTGKQRMDHIKQKSTEYYGMREIWRTAIQHGPVTGELAYVTGMVRKDVLRTDRLHPFYAGDDDNKNIASLFNILTTYALNHPSVSYCQGMSDIASPLLVTMCDEAQAYICFCAIMKRLGPNFMLDGISMTQKFAHLADALQFYDPEFYEYLKMQQADDLLFCYRWLLLEMKREFAFEDSLRMLEVLWSSIPPDPPVGELKLFEKEFVPLTLAQMSPKATCTTDTVVMRKRETPYSNLCALRRQSSSQSLLATSPSTLNTIETDSSSINAAIAINTKGHLDATKKRFNHSLDENVTRSQANNVHHISKSFQSLDESKLRHMARQRATTTSIIYSNDLNEQSAVNNFEVENNEKNQHQHHQQQQQKQQVSAVISSPNNYEQKDSPIASTKQEQQQQHQQQRTEQYTANNNIISPSNNHSSTAMPNTTQTGSGNFKSLKDRITAGKKEIFASLDKIERLPFDNSSAKSSDNSEESDAPPKSGKIVKNFNEFLNFASKGAKLTLIRSASVSSKDSKTRSSMRLTKSTHHNLNSNKASEAEDTCRRDGLLPKFNEQKPNQNQINSTTNKKALQLQLEDRKQSSFDGSSPDDSEYFPMTTSITRELRLELDNLNRQVFGNSFSPKIHANGGFMLPQSNTPPCSGGSLISNIRSPAANLSTEISYKKFNQNSEDDIQLDRNTISQFEKDDVVKNLKCASSSSINADVFIWENPLHQLSPTTTAINTADGCSGTSIAHQTGNMQQQRQHFDECKNPFYAKDFLQTLTPDEQTELEYDGELIDEITGKKSITPIRLIRKQNDDGGGNKKVSSSQRNSNYFRTSDSETESSENSEKIMNNLMKTSMLSETNPFLMDIAAEKAAAAAAASISSTQTINVDSMATINTKDVFVDEEASEAETVPNAPNGDGDAVELEKMPPPTSLPPPSEFGGGNPFLMFLCLSLLLQHRNFVMKNNMDYNEMAMHFDKMVRKHNVVRVLNQARRMYSDYLKSQQQQPKYRITTKIPMASTTKTETAVTTTNVAAAAASIQRPSNT